MYIIITVVLVNIQHELSTLCTTLPVIHEEYRINTRYIQQKSSRNVINIEYIQEKYRRNIV